MINASTHTIYLYFAKRTMYIHKTNKPLFYDFLYKSQKSFHIVNFILMTLQNACINFKQTKTN